MDEFVKYIDLPQIPEDLLLTNLEDIKNLETRMTTPSELYMTYNAPLELYEFIQQGFSTGIQVRYQVMNGQLPVHIDADFRGVSHVYNYGISTGGDNVKTRWWDQDVIEEKRIAFDGGHFDIIWGDEVDSDPLYETVIEPKRWHQLTVNVPHDISKLDSPRTSVRFWQETQPQLF